MPNFVDVTASLETIHGGAPRASTMRSAWNAAKPLLSRAGSALDRAATWAGGAFAAKEVWESWSGRDTTAQQPQQPPANQGGQQ